MQQVINSVLDYLFNNPGTLIAALCTGTGVSIVLQLIKHFGKFDEAKKLIMILLGVLSVGATLADQAWIFTGQNTALLNMRDLGWVITAAVFMHRFAVSPAYYGALKGLSFYNNLLTDASAYRTEKAQLAAAAAPASPADSVVAPEQQFTIPQ
jgi:hypothetical protein